MEQENKLVWKLVRVRENLCAIVPMDCKRLHDEDNENCWCKPEIMQECPECKGEPLTPPDVCWYCKGRHLVLAYDEEAPAVIIHRNVPDAESGDEDLVFMEDLDKDKDGENNKGENNAKV